MSKMATKGNTTSSTSNAGKAASVRPLGDKILVKRDEAQSKTQSGIFLPETSKDKPKTGIVEAVGTGSLNTETGERIPLSVKKGDRVIFSSYAGTEVKLDSAGELLIMSEDDILAIVD